MIDAQAKYQAALAAFATPGGRWANKGALTYWGKAAGLSADDIITDARAAGVTNRDGSIRSGWEDAKPKFINGKPTANYTPRAKRQPPPPEYPNHVPKILAGMNAEQGTFDWVRELSPCLDWLGQPPEAQAAAFIRAAFRDDERVFVFHDGGSPGILNLNLKLAGDWLANIRHLLNMGGLIKINTFTGSMGNTSGGKRSLVSMDCIADYPYALLEFDDMPLAMQCAFWRGFILTDNLAPYLLSLVFSGGKSIHGLLYVGCSTINEWQETRKRLIGLFAANPDHRLKVDEQALHPLIGTRIPGAVRKDKNARQELLYLNPAARG